MSWYFYIIISVFFVNFYMFPIMRNIPGRYKQDIIDYWNQSHCQNYWNYYSFNSFLDFFQWLVLYFLKTFQPGSLNILLDILSIPSAGVTLSRYPSASSFVLLIAASSIYSGKPFWIVLQLISFISLHPIYVLVLILHKIGHSCPSGILPKILPICSKGSSPKTLN